MLTNAQIRQIQAALNAQGWTADDKPLAVDGILGLNTLAVIRAFQEQQGLVVDGIPGILTLAALLPNEARNLAVGQVEPQYDFSTKAGTVAAIRAECRKQGLPLDAQHAYVLATVEWETNRTFRPVREAYYLGGTEATREAWRQRNLRYYPYYGRGYVQLTWKANYQKYAAVIGKDLVAHPDLAMHPPYACIILVDGFKRGLFTGAKLEQYVNGNKADFVNARRCINGTDKARDIAVIALRWLEEM